MERVELRDVTLPPGLQRSMAAEAEAVREAHAKVHTTHTHTVLVRDGAFCHVLSASVLSALQLACLCRRV